MKSLLALVTVAATAPSAHALCAMPQIGDVFLSRDTQGAVLVVTRTGAVKGAFLEKLTFRVDGKAGAFDKVQVAPGLVAYRLPAGATRGEIDGGTGGVAKVVATDPKAPPLAAPTLTKLTVVTTMGIRGSSVTGTATLDAEPPAGTIAIVVTDDKGKALSWGGIQPAKEQVILNRGRCGMLPDGTTSPVNNQAVKVFFVDAMGRVSPSSRSVKASVTTENQTRR